jgi:BlaI family penicillinase repressor
MASMQLGRVQLLIMQVLWDEERATARQITDAINRSERIAHSTVQTMLRVLEEKRAVSHQPEGRTFVFFPLVAESEFKQTATQNLLERVFGGSPSSLVAHLLDCQSVSKREIDEIRKLIKRQHKR